MRLKIPWPQSHRGTLRHLDVSATPTRISEHQIDGSRELWSREAGPMAGCDSRARQCDRSGLMVRERGFARNSITVQTRICVRSLDDLQGEASPLDDLLEWHWI